ncbi:MAG: paraslipin [Leptonema sp. (in: Bacteria)]|nr:paraslipin [Leptonema sp. (in: bacteria)]
MLFISALFLLFVIFIIWKTFIVVPHQHAYVQERLGNFNGVLNSGFHFLIPIIDRVAYRHTLKEESIEVPSQVCITKDNVQVEVDGILYMKVIDPKLASYGISNYRFASIQLAQTNMRSEIGKLDLDHTLMERESINDEIIEALDVASDPWGVKVTRYEIKNIMPPKTVLATMEKQMTAEREKRAEIFHSEGERSATINHSEGERQESINISEGEKLRRINEAEGRASQIELIANSTAEAIQLVAAAIARPGGDQAMKLRIAEEFIKEFGQVVKTSRTQVIPLGPAVIQSFFQGLSGMTEAFKNDSSSQFPKPPHK